MRVHVVVVSLFPNAFVNVANVSLWRSEWKSQVLGCCNMKTREGKKLSPAPACCLPDHCCMNHAAGNRLHSTHSQRGEELQLDCTECGGGPQVYGVCVCVKCVTSKQRLVWVGPIHRDRLEQLRSICNISRSCGPNNLGGKWVMTVALGPDTLTMFDELPKGWGDDHLNDHTTERNGTEYDGISRWVCSQNPQHIFGLPVSYQPAWQLHMYAHTCAYVYTQYYSHSLASAGVGSFECITHLSL